MPIKNGDVVKVEYEGSFDDGEVFDSTEAHDGTPLEVTVGAQEVIPGFDASLVGKEKDDEYTIRLEPSEAYGDYNPQGLQNIERDKFPSDVELEPGMMLGIRQQHGDHTHEIPAFVKDVNDKNITLDFNHPLAGKTLNFKIKVVEVQPA